MEPEAKQPFSQTWIDLKISLVERFGWSLREIADTDIEDLIPFVARLIEKDGSKVQQTDEIATAGKERQPRNDKRVYCDQVSWM